VNNGQRDFEPEWLAAAVGMPVAARKIAKTGKLFAERPYTPHMPALHCRARKPPM
jgi:hypothetical protein